VKKFLYNVTINIDLDVHDEWLEWMKTVHVPKVMATGMFDSFRIFRLLNDPSNEGATYSFQYFAQSLDAIELYLGKYAPPLIEEHMEKYKNKHVAFRTLLEEVA